MIILEKGERADQLWGMDTEIITDEMIEALEQGKRLYLSVNDEYAVVIKKNGKRKTDKPEQTDSDTISRQDTIEHLKKRLYESALNNEGVVSETMEEIADNRIQIWMDELPPSPCRPILNGDDDNYCSFAESEVNISFVPVSEFYNAKPSCNLTDEQLKELHDAFI